ncbi:MAG: hypothetical protein ACLGIP_18095 [Alphaproteobacteria bacterium]
MGGVLDYSTTANSNTTVGGVSIAEGMAPGNVNNAIRAEMADARKWQLDWSGITTAGTGNAYTITSNQGISAYADGMRFSFRADRANTGAATLNVDGRGAKALRKVTGGALAALVADDIVVGAVYDVVYLSGDDVFVIVGFAGLQASAFAKTLLDDATAADARTTLGVVIGTDVQAQGATLSSLEGLTLAEGDLLYATGPDKLVNLAKGTAGRVLQMNSGATAPEWADAVVGWKLVETLDTSSGTTKETSNFEAGRSYMFVFQGVGHNAGTTEEFTVAFYGETAAAYTAAIVCTDGVAATSFIYGAFYYEAPKISRNTHIFAGFNIGNATASTSDTTFNLTPGRFGAGANYATAQGVSKVRFAVNSGAAFDSGNILVYKR